MNIAATIAEINSLPVDDRLRIVDAIWEGIEGERGGQVMMESVKQELDRRIADADANPDDEISREEVMSWLRSDS
jgi:putative addiction module component (TIGR02574 family)